MKRKFHLTRSTDIQRVRRSGRSYAHPLVVLVAHPNQSDLTRLAVTAGRGVGGAVQRNRAKRLIRAAMDPLWGDLAPGWDLVVLARQPLVQSSCAQTQSALITLLKRANLLSTPYVT